ncbi:hypothetical protein J1605_011748 [Eschrichtius robustus]|uniref:Uncharacterized protein n=1 Tax=Eschrichtius robustus TaxID=9764 RepID=A0AB34GPX2_ESCRO|nr:hypothetical protein J1605_011748 [Eschrichtius robustus]
MMGVKGGALSPYLPTGYAPLRLQGQRAEEPGRVRGRVQTATPAQGSSSSPAALSATPRFSVPGEAAVAAVGVQKEGESREAREPRRSESRPAGQQAPHQAAIETWDEDDPQIRNHRRLRGLRASALQDATQQSLLL